MQRRVGLMGLAAGLMILAGSRILIAQDISKIPQPGPEHKVLDALAGTWDAQAKMYLEPGKPAQESAGVSKRVWILDGRFLQDHFEGKVFGTSFKGLGLNGYDMLKKQYVMVWLDSMSTGVMLSHGAYDAKTKTFTYQVDDVDPTTGAKMKGRDLLRIVSDNEHVLEMFRTPEKGSEFKMMEIKYTRKAK